MKCKAWNKPLTYLNIVSLTPTLPPLFIVWFLWLLTTGVSSYFKTCNGPIAWNLMLHFNSHVHFWLKFLLQKLQDIIFTRCRNLLSVISHNCPSYLYFALIISWIQLRPVVVIKKHFLVLWRFFKPQCNSNILN